MLSILGIAGRRKTFGWTEADRKRRGPAQQHRPPSSNVSNHCGQFQGRADDTAYCKGRKEEGDEDDHDADVDKPFPRHCMTLQGGMMTAVDVRRPNSHHVVRGRILCERLKVTPRERIKVSRCTNVCHLLQGGLEDTEDFSLWKVV